MVLACGQYIDILIFSTVLIAAVQYIFIIYSIL